MLRQKYPWHLDRFFGGVDDEISADKMHRIDQANNRNENHIPRFLDCAAQCNLLINEQLQLSDSAYIRSNSSFL